MGEQQKIAIIGGGNMGGAIARGIVKAGLAQAGQVVVTVLNNPVIEWAMILELQCA